MVVHRWLCLVFAWSSLCGPVFKMGRFDPSSRERSLKVRLKPCPDGFWTDHDFLAIFARVEFFIFPLADNQPGASSGAMMDLPERPCTRIYDLHGSFYRGCAVSPRERRGRRGHAAAHRSKFCLSHYSALFGIVLGSAAHLCRAGCMLRA